MARARKSGGASVVSAQIKSAIEQRFQKAKVIVWYDPEQWFGDVVDALEGDGVRVERLQGGYFRMRRCIDELVKTLRDGRDAPRLLVHVPTDRLPDADNLLLALECLGGTARHKPSTVARRALETTFPDGQVDEWLALPGITLAKLDELASASSDIAPLDAVFGKITATQVGFELLRQPSHVAEVYRQGLAGNLRDLLDEAFGVRLPDVDVEPEDMRDAFAQRVLLHEFLDDLDEVPEELSALRSPDAATQVAACRELAARLRDTRSVEAEYRRWADETQRRFELEAPAYDPAKLGRLDTFEFEDRLALQHVCALAAENRLSEADAWAAERSRSFWPTTDRLRAVRWRATRLAIDLRRAVEEVSATIPQNTEPVAWVHWYTASDSEGAAEPWRVDRYLRELNALSIRALGDTHVETLVHDTRNIAEKLEHTLAERFVDSLRAASGEVGRGPMQLGVFRDHVRPLLEEPDQKVAFVLADALRFEMGTELSQQLAGSGDVTVEWAIATFPTITKVGMAALLPGAEEGIELVSVGKKVVPKVKDRDLSDIRSRWRLFEEAYGERIVDLPLDRCLTSPQKKLEQVVDKADLVLLRSQEIDEIGEADKIAYARSTIGQIVTSLHQAIQRLARAGVERFVITADHGFLLREDIDDASKLGLPAGSILESHRRCAFGRGLAGGQDHVVFRAAELGLGGDLEIAFPRGINVFRVGGGNLFYQHGGLSLQEIVVPVVGYSPGQTPRRGGKSTVVIELAADKITALYPRAVLRYSTEDLLDAPEQRRFRVVAMKDDQIVGELVQATHGYDEQSREVSLASGEESEAILALAPELEGRGTLDLVVIDVELGDRVALQEVTFDLSF